MSINKETYTYKHYKSSSNVRYPYAININICIIFLFFSLLAYSLCLHGRFCCIKICIIEQYEYLKSRKVASFPYFHLMAKVSLVHNERCALHMPKMYCLLVKIWWYNKPPSGLCLLFCAINGKVVPCVTLQCVSSRAQGVRHIVEHQTFPILFKKYSDDWKIEIVLTVVRIMGNPGNHNYL